MPESEKKEEKTKGLLVGAHGTISSKRVAGFLALLCTVGVAVFAVLRDPASVRDVMWPLAAMTGALFGATVLEKKQ